MKFTKRGIITTKRGQIKKHYTQFNEEDKNIIEKYREQLIQQQQYNFTDHLRKKRLPLTHKFLFNVFKYGKALEVNYNPNSKENRVLFRGNQRIILANQVYNLCLVYSVQKNIIVTAYYNLADDHHDTIDFDKYIENSQYNIWI